MADQVRLRVRGRGPRAVRRPLCPPHVLKQTPLPPRAGPAAATEWASRMGRGPPDLVSARGVSLVPRRHTDLACVRGGARCDGPTA